MPKEKQDTMRRLGKGNEAQGNRVKWGRGDKVGHKERGTGERKGRQQGLKDSRRRAQGQEVRLRGLQEGKAWEFWKHRTEYCTSRKRKKESELRAWNRGR